LEHPSGEERIRSQFWKEGTYYPIIIAPPKKSAENEIAFPEKELQSQPEERTIVKSPYWVKKVGVGPAKKDISS